MFFSCGAFFGLLFGQLRLCCAKFPVVSVTALVSDGHHRQQGLVVLPSVRSDTAFASDGKPKRSEMRVGTMGLLIRNCGAITSCHCLNKKPGIAVGLPATTSGSRALAHRESTVRGNDLSKKKAQGPIFNGFWQI